MNTIKIIIGVIVFLSAYTACGNKQNNPASNSDSTVSAEALVNNVKPANRDTSFEARNYLKLSNLYSGSVFEDAETRNSLFFRIVEIEEEEHLLLYVEKISIGEEGGNYKLVSRYRLEEKALGLPSFSLHSLDSLSFTDSVTAVGYFNKIKYKLDLNTQTAAKN